MIVGKGMLAQAFSGFEQSPDIVVFASGVSDSLEDDPQQYQREYDLLESIRLAYPEHKLVYFSSCSIADADRYQTPYVQHKIRIEQHLEDWGNPYICIRLPAVIGHSNIAKTLPYYLRNKILADEEFDVWVNAKRYLMDVDDVVMLGSEIIGDPANTGSTIDLALVSYDVGEMVNSLEKILGRQAMIRKLERGCPYDLDLSLAHKLASQFGIGLDQNYLTTVLGKYFSAVSELASLPAIAGGHPVRSEQNRIYFGAPVIGDREVEAVTECLRSRWIGLGPRVETFEKAFAEYKGAAYSVAVSSGTAALHLALLALGIGEGDEVIVPTMTFCATAQAVELVGATPVFIDCDPLTLNISCDAIECAINSRTKVILVVHYGGRCCDMDRIMSLASNYALRVVEDCAHAVESSYHGVAAGLIGDIGCFSFYATKSITTADGGMMIFKDEGLIKNVRQLSLHGMNRDAWSRVKGANGYSIISPGYKYNMTDMEAALGLAQLEQVDQRCENRAKVWQIYGELLRDLPLTLPASVETNTRMAYHLHPVILDSSKLTVDAEGVVSALRAENIGAGIHYLPLHMQPYFQQKFGLLDVDFPNASAVGRHLFSLPLNADFSIEDVEDVCHALKRILTYCRRR